MNYAKKLIKTGDSVPGWETGTVRWRLYSDPLTCSQVLSDFAALTTWAARIAITTATAPTLGAPRDCVDVQPPNPATQTGTISANPGIGTFSTSNNGTRWKVTLNSSYAVTGSNHAYYFIDGEKRSDFGGFDFLPGDQISVYYVVAPTDQNYDNWNAKCWALITFGNIA